MQEKRRYKRLPIQLTLEVSDADIQVGQPGSISTAHQKLMDYEIQIGLRKKGDIYPVSFYPN